MDRNNQQIISHNKKAWNRQVKLVVDGLFLYLRSRSIARTEVPKIYLSSGTPIPESWVRPFKKEICSIACRRWWSAKLVIEFIWRQCDSS